jgi:hypothetical protein
MKTIVACVAMLLASTAVAAAGTKSFIIKGSDMQTANGGAISGATIGFTGVSLANTFSDVVVNFTVPADYKKNSPISIKLRMFLGGVSCTISLGAAGVYRYRPGVDVTVETVGLTNDNGDVFTRPASLTEINTRSYTLRKAGGGPFVTGSIADQRAGDGISAIIRRAGSSISDSCTDLLIINSAKITYTTN